MKNTFKRLVGAALVAAPLVARATTSVSHALSPSSGPSQLAAERALLDDARAALVGGQPARALERLTKHRQAFLNPMLAEERDATATTARCARGDHPFGVNLLDEFVQRHPASVYRARVEQACAATDSPATGDSSPRRSE